MRGTMLRFIGAVGVRMVAVAGLVLAVGTSGEARAASNTQSMPNGVSLKMPTMNPVRGKQLFASKGCVVCHSINGVGGTDAPHLDASTMPPMMNPFEFFSKMWRGAPAMIAMQKSEIGHQIEFTGQDLADIVAFVHDGAVQKTFSQKDIPAAIKTHMGEDK